MKPADAALEPIEECVVSLEPETAVVLHLTQERGEVTRPLLVTGLAPHQNHVGLRLDLDGRYHVNLCTAEVDHGRVLAPVL